MVGLATALSLAVAGAAVAAPPDGTPEAPAPARRRGLALRFAWPSDLEARVTYRRVHSPARGPVRAFTARYRERAVRDGAGYRITTSRTRWEGEIPYPADEVKAAIRASEAVVQRIDADGAFEGLENVDALRPVLQRVYAAAGLPDDEADRAIARVEAAMLEEARDGWNLAVGFWIGAELDLGEAWEREVDAPVWLLPAVAVKRRVRMEARRRVPCTASERRARCVELVLHSEPERAALPALHRAVAARLAGDAGPLPRGELRDVGVVTDLSVVSDPRTLLPYRATWRRAVRASLVDDAGARDLEDVERTEWTWVYVRRGPPVR